MKRITTLIVLLSVVAVTAQDGTRVFEFLNITTNPRQAALGGNAQSMWDKDPNNSLWNPALVNYDTHRQLGVNYVNYLADVKFGTISYVYQYDTHNFFSIHGQYVDYGDFVAADDIGNITGDFDAKDAAITLSYARKLSDFFTVGAGVKYIHSSIESYKSSGIAMDLGVVFHDIDYGTNVALSVRNIGTQLSTYNGVKEDMPLQVNLGISHVLEHVPLELTATLHDLQKFDISEQTDSDGVETSNLRKAIDHLSVGAELFPQRGFNLRAGYNFKRGNELSTEEAKSFSGLSFGFGIKVNSFRFEYAHARYSAASNANYFGLIIDLESMLESRFY